MVFHTLNLTIQLLPSSIFVDYLQLIKINILILYDLFLHTYIYIYIYIYIYNIRLCFTLIKINKI